MKLSDVQMEKLMMLSVVSIAKQRMDGNDDDVDMADSRSKSSRQRKAKRPVLLSIPYSELASKLHLPSDDGRKLEDLLIQCIYAKLLSAKLDQCSQCLIIEPNTSLVRDDGNAIHKSKTMEICGSILSRDLPATTSQIPQMISRLESFLSHTDSLLTTLEQCALSNNAVRKSESLRWKEVHRLLNESNANAKFGGLERVEFENVERREVKRSKMLAAAVQRFS
jgi:hypothetical protein